MSHFPLSSMPFGERIIMASDKQFSLTQIQIGHRFTPLVYPVSEALIFKYAEAVDDSNSFYKDPVKASSGPFQGIIAPPTLASLFVLKAYRTDWIPPPGGIHLKQTFKFHGPLRPGDILTVQAELTQKVETRGNWYLTFNSHAKNQNGETVVWSESTSVWGNLKEEVIKNRNPKTTPFQSQTAAIANDPGSPTQGWAIGDPLPSLIKKITKEKIDQYEEILGIGNPVHFDEEYARSTPFGGVIAHGLMSTAYISESLMEVFPWEWVHDGEMEIRFLHPVRPGDVVQTQSGLKEKKSSEKGVILIFDVACENQHGETVLLGTAIVPIFQKK
jgi:3-hydroxybutyryl-CoA dehydratase